MKTHWESTSQHTLVVSVNKSSRLNVLLGNLQFKAEKDSTKVIQVKQLILDV